MQLSWDRPARCARLAFTIALAMVWCGMGDERAGAQPQPAGGVAPAAGALTEGAQLARALAALDALGQSTPRDSFDPQAVVAKVGRDPAALFAWVRVNTWWVPYRGALRGPAGVLMDRVGNSLDRSLLLAELLRLAGHPVRLARAALDEETAGPLLEQVKAYPGRSAVAQREQTPEQVRAQVEQCARAGQLDVARAMEDFDGATWREEQVNEEMVQRTAEQTVILAAAVQAPAADAAAQQAERLAALRDHWWVQCQQGGKWVDLDVLLPKAEAGQAVAPAKVTLPVKPQDGSVVLPDDARQDVTIRVVIESWQGGKVKTATPLTTKLEAREAGLVPITLQNVPVDWPKDVPLTGPADAAALKKAVLAQKRWMPVLTVGKRPIVNQGFGDDGQLQARSRFEGEQKLANSVGGVMGGFGGALGGGEDEPADASGQLSAEWIEFELRAPGQAPRVIRQEVFDLIGPAARQDKQTQNLKVDEAQQLQRSLRLLGPVRVLAVSCRPTNDYMTCLVAEGAQELRRAVKADGSIDQTRLLDAMVRGGLAHSPLYRWATLRWSGGRSGELAYLDRLNLVSQRIEADVGTAGLLVADRLDVLANEVAVASADRAFAARLEQGVTDTVAEDYCVSATDPLENTTGIIAAAMGQGRRPALVRQAGQGDWDSLAPAARARVQQDLTGGYAVVLAATTSNDPSARRAAWWRVDATAGHTIGVMDSGYHQAMTEYYIAAFVGGAILGVVICVGQGIYYAATGQVNAINGAMNQNQNQNTSNKSKRKGIKNWGE